jgi:uncharacterized lipoprotein YddW (UPF0748 family)
MYRLIILSLSIIFPSLCFAQTIHKREFRAAWIATVSNIDWPSKQGLPSYQQQQEFIGRLDQLKKIGCNAVIVQIRPAADAFYPSDYEAWSRFLTGRQGQPPFPYYDPLKFMIEETHKRCMEFHAWFNPFRALTDKNKNPNPPNHVTYKHRDWIIPYGDKSYINPGIPEARDYNVQVIMDVVKRYDIDAVHMDDYFYPYRIAGVEFGDSKSFQQYGNGFTDKGDWRRNNVNIFVETLYKTIKKEKPYVKLGISPFGVWRNASKDPEGSATRGGQTCYDDLYADVLLWQRKGWVDYVLPQLYWEHNHRAAAFDVLLPWWENHKYNRHVYYGLGLYRMAESHSNVWSTPNEILWQIRDIRNKTSVASQVFYSMSSFDKISISVSDSISKYNMYYAFPPAMPWIDTSTPPSPIVKAIPSNQGTLLQWNMPKYSGERVVFAVYRFVNNEPVNLERADKIINVLNEKEFLDAKSNSFQKCTYVVTAFDRLWNESKNAVPVVVSQDK